MPRSIFLFFVYVRGDWSGLHRLTDAAKNLTSVTQLPRTTQMILLALFPLNLVFMVAFTYSYDWLGPALWTATIVLSAMALMIPVGTALVYVGNRFKGPVIGPLLALAVAFSLFNDNHRVCQIAEMRPSEPVARVMVRRQVPRGIERSLQPYQDLESYCTAWTKDLQSMHRGGAIPVFPGAAEGSGVWAVHWTGPLGARPT